MATDQVPHDPGRRDALRKVLIGAGVAAAAPAITTFNAPASAEILSNATNQFQLQRSDPPALAPGPMTAVDPTTGSGCEPAAWGGANPTVAADFTGAGSGTGATVSGTTDHLSPGLISLPLLGTQAQAFNVQMEVTLPPGCAFTDVADAEARITAVATKNEQELIPFQSVPSGPQCATNITVNQLSNGGRTVQFGATFTEHYTALVGTLGLSVLGAYSNVTGVTVRIAAFCNV